VAATQSPIVFLGTGEGFEQLELFNAGSFISRLLGMGDIRGLAEKMEEMKLDVNHPELIDNLTQGRFSYRDMRSVLETFMQAGSLSQMMDMMPGPVGKFFRDMQQAQGSDPANTDRDSFSRLKAFMTVMDSMTAEELESIKPLSPTRISRLVRGSGQNSRVVQALIEAHKVFSRFGSQFKVAKHATAFERERERFLSKCLNESALAVLSGGRVLRLGGGGAKGRKGKEGRSRALPANLLC